MMKLAETAKTNLPFKECLVENLEGFKDLAYVDKICKQFYGSDV